MEQDEFKTYLFEYSYKGATWDFDIKATSPEDAIARLHAMIDANYLGLLKGSVPARFGTLARLICWLRNRRV